MPELIILNMQIFYSDHIIPADIALISGSGYHLDSQSMTHLGSVSYLEFLPKNADAVFSKSDGGNYFKLKNGKNLLAFNKRLHKYQGFSFLDTVLPVRIAKASGVKIILLANSAGGLNRELNTGDFLVLNDHLIFPFPPDFSPEFNPDQIDTKISPYDKSLSDILFNSIKSVTGNAIRGTYAFMPGPAYETKAEVEFLKSLGADVVGMSTAYEALYAHLTGIKVVGISLVTNVHDAEVNEI
ncbi:purine-nucleoside phosphorylase, partial [bacterium]|nr:purine-nucleoside phosphorylase [bacterium]MBU1025488.1 purine-nucleoside phosphorylase [bacterium]